MRLIITLITIILLLYINLNFLWDNGNRGLSEFGNFLIEIFLFFSLVIIQIPLLISLKINFDIKKLILQSINIICLIFIFFYPRGIYYPTEKRIPYLIAFNEGAINCSTRLSLFKNREFKEVNICFGKTTSNGIYKVVNDTIIFEIKTLGKNEKRFYKYAVINKNKMELTRYYENDSLKTGKLYIKTLNLN